MSDRATPLRRRYEKGFWAWVERQVIQLRTDPDRRVAFFRFAWWTSIAFIAVGVAYMALALTGQRIF